MEIYVNCTLTMKNQLHVT